jgi:hypothetical protein
MKGETIVTDNGWMTKRMVEVVRSRWLQAEIRPVEGGDGRWCDLVLSYEDDTAYERMHKALEPLAAEFEGFLSILDGRHIAGRAINL